MKNFSNIYFSRGILSEKDSGRRKWTAADKRSHETEERKKALKGCIIKCVCVCVCVRAGGSGDGGDGGDLLDHTGTCF